MPVEAAVKPGVFVIDDNQALAENIAELFRDAGAVVSACSSVADAIRLAGENAPFDLAVVDVRLPDATDDLDLVAMLRARSPSGEVILMTGNATVDTAIDAVRHGVFAFVQKPFLAEDLLALGERALAQVALRRDREELARELAGSEAIYRAVVDSVEALIVGLDDEGRIEFCNRLAAETTGWTAREVRGRPFAEVATVERHRRALVTAVGEARQGTRVRDRELPLRSKDGRLRVVRWTMAPLVAEDASTPLLLAVGLDVTERIELERRTAQSEAMATMGTLTAGLAHEVRNPLNAAKLQLELLGRQAARLADRAVADRIHERVEIVKDEIGRLSILLDDFLSLARPKGLSVEPLFLLPLLQEVAHLEGPLAAAAGIQIEVEHQSNELPASADRGKVKQVLVNLIGNAIEAMRSQGAGRVTLATTQRGEAWTEVTVRDTGPGIPAELLERVFEPFFTTKEAGTGLGLTLVKRIVELHGGRVDVGPAPERGTLVRFTLPRP